LTAAAQPPQVIPLTFTVSFTAAIAILHA
jgi:hypothetical protein